MEYLIDESGRQKFLQLLADRPALELVEASQALLHRLGVGSDVKGVLGDLPRYARHVRGAPRNDVCVGTEKVDEHHFLFVVEGGADLQCLDVGVVRVEGDVLGTLGRLEAARMPLLGVHGLVRHVLQLCGEGLVHHQCLSVLDAFNVTLVGMLE